MTPASRRGVILMEKAHKNLHLLFSLLVMGLGSPSGCRMGGTTGMLVRTCPGMPNLMQADLTAFPGRGRLHELLGHLPTKTLLSASFGAPRASSHSDSPIQEA